MNWILIFYVCFATCEQDRFVKDKYEARVSRQQRILTFLKLTDAELAKKVLTEGFNKEVYIEIGQNVCSEVKLYKIVEEAK